MLNPYTITWIYISGADNLTVGSCVVCYSFGRATTSPSFARLPAALCQAE